MKISNINSNNSFGFTPKTHAFITNVALRNFPELQQHSRLITSGCESPDIILTQSGVGNYSHNFFGPNSDITRKDALSIYLEHVNEAINQLKNANSKYALYRAGNALHYLQDVSSPLHTKKETANFLYFIPHALYERKIPKQHFNLMRNAIKNNPEVKSIYYLDNFIETAEKSQKMPNPLLQKNKNLSQKTMEESIALAYSSTNSFFKFLEDLRIALKIHDHEKVDKLLYGAKYIKN